MTTRYDLTAEECTFLVNALTHAAGLYRADAARCREVEGHSRLAEQFDRQVAQAEALAEAFERGI